MTEEQCNECGSNVFIVEYYNTELDSVTSIDIMSGQWVNNHKDVVERIDCIRCDNIVYLNQEQ
jgi:ribosomal protein S27AE